MNKLVSLDIETIPEELYQNLLSEFKKQFGDGFYVDWELTAIKEQE